MKSESALSLCLCVSDKDSYIYHQKFQARTSKWRLTSLIMSFLLYCKIGRSWMVASWEGANTCIKVSIGPMSVQSPPVILWAQTQQLLLTLALKSYKPTWFWLFCSNSICDHFHPFVKITEQLAKGIWFWKTSKTRILSCLTSIKKRHWISPYRLLVTKDRKNSRKDSIMVLKSLFKNFPVSWKKPTAETCISYCSWKRNGKCCFGEKLCSV